MNRFYLTVSAVEQFARFERMRHASDADFEKAELKLQDRASRAAYVRAQANGMQEWRLKQDAVQYGAKQRRYRLLVGMPEREGGMKRVVQVLPETALGRRRG